MVDDKLEMLGTSAETDRKQRMEAFTSDCSTRYEIVMVRLGRSVRLLGWGSAGYKNVNTGPTQCPSILFLLRIFP